MVDERRVTRVVKLAYELAQTGVFEDFAAIERELISLGYADEARSLEKPSIRDTLSEICANRPRARGKRPGISPHVKRMMTTLGYFAKAVAGFCA